MEFLENGASIESLIAQNKLRIAQKTKAIEEEKQLLITGDKHRSNERIKNNIKRLEIEIEQFKAVFENLQK